MAGLADHGVRVKLEPILGIGAEGHLGDHPRTLTVHGAPFRNRVGLSWRKDAPPKAIYPARMRVPDNCPRRGFRIDHQREARADPSPFLNVPWSASPLASQFIGEQPE